MRILLITDNHSLSGGAEHYFFDLKKRLQKVPGFAVYSLGFGQEKIEGKDFLILKKIKSNFTKLIWQLLPHPFMYFKLRQHIKKIQPDIIHLHNIKQYTASLLPAVRPYPCVQTMHDYSMICPSGYNIHKNLQVCETGLKARCYWQHQVKKYTLFSYIALTLAFFKIRYQLKKTVKTFLAPSPLLANYLNRNQFKPALYLAPFKKESTHPSFNTINPHHFLFAGNLGVHKGIYLLVEEFALAHEKNPGISLTIAGTGPEEKQLRKRVTELGLEKHIHFAGWQENLENEYTKCAALIFPSLGLETFGLVMTEAMAHSRPVIGGNRGTPPWVIDDKQTGLLFDPLKKGDLAEKILELAGNRDLITELGSKGEEKLRTFIDNERALKEIIELYRGIR